jgi:hypothetical protein
MLTCYLLSIILMPLIKRLIAMENAGLIPLPQDDLELQSEVKIPGDVGDDTNLEAEDEITESTYKPELTAEEKQKLNNALLSAVQEGNAD